MPGLICPVWNDSRVKTIFNHILFPVFSVHSPFFDDDVCNFFSSHSSTYHQTVALTALLEGKSQITYLKIMNI